MKVTLTLTVKPPRAVVRPGQDAFDPLAEALALGGGLLTQQDTTVNVEPPEATRLVFVYAGHVSGYLAQVMGQPLYHPHLVSSTHVLELDLPDPS